VYVRVYQPWVCFVGDDQAVTGAASSLKEQMNNTSSIFAKYRQLWACRDRCVTPAVMVAKLCMQNPIIHDCRALHAEPSHSSHGQDRGVGADQLMRRDPCLVRGG
jgi:hypothetical protein